MTLQALHDALRGDIVLPPDEGYDEARLAWNRSVDQRPAAVAVPADVEDLRLIVAAARDEGLRVLVQPRGHGASESLGGVVVIRMDAFDSVELDGSVMRVGAGVGWRQALEVLDAHAATSDLGLVAPIGTSAVVSVAGLLLNGGQGWLSRLSGISAQRLRRVELLRVDGTHGWVDDTSEPELMWMLRGAGGLAGVVTAVEFDTVEAPSLIGGSLTFDIADAPAVLRAIRDIAPEAPNAVAVFFSTMRMPDLPFLPEAIRGRRWASVEVVATGDDGGVVDAIRNAAPPTSDTIAPQTPSSLADIAGDPEDPGAASGWATVLDELDDAFIDQFTSFHASDDAAPFVGLQLRMLGGASAAKPRPGFAGLPESAQWLVYSVAPHPLAGAVAGDPAAGPERAANAVAALQRLVGDRAGSPVLPTFLSPGDTLARAASADNLTRLRAIRSAVDPDGVMHPMRLPD